jgi:3D (Asp-Asp-Asp) domain-containing protein
MRIIRLMIALLVFWTVAFPQNTLAAAELSSNETKTKLVSEEIIKIPYKFNGYQEVKQIKYKGGKFAINASAYTAAADECGKSDGITASGKLVKENHTIACPPQYKLGTKIEIEGRGVYTCEDRGGAIKGNHIDIYVKTKAQAFSFGRRNLTARVVES